MKKVFYSLLMLCYLPFCANAQTFKMDTLLFNGDKSKYINLVILGDGYQASELGTFTANATNFMNYIFSTSPWSNYKNYTNVFAVRVISTASGAKHPNTASDCSSAFPLVPVSNATTYFGSTFDYYGTHRLLVPTNNTAISNVLATYLPQYDQAFVIVNSPNYGGSGGSYATASTETTSNEIMLHETGHSFANLADEYYAGDVYAFEKPNMTKESNTGLAKWKNWVGINSVGVYQHCCGGNSAQWYKPHQTCKMQYLGYAFCSVCKQTIIEKIHSLVNPIVAYTPTTSSINLSTNTVNFALTKLMKPTPNTLKIQWTLDGNIVAKNVESYNLNQAILSLGSHTLTALVIDTTSLLKVDNHASVHFSKVNWQFTKTVTAMDILSGENKLSFTLYPNPASEEINFSLEMEKSSPFSVKIIDLEGKTVQTISGNGTKGEMKKSLTINSLPIGKYIIQFESEGSVSNFPFIKE